MSQPCRTLAIDGKAHCEALERCVTMMMQCCCSFYRCIMLCVVICALFVMVWRESEGLKSENGARRFLSAVLHVSHSLTHSSYFSR